MADNRRPSKDVASGRRGVFFGAKWRIIEDRYPDTNGPLCLVAQYQLDSGWKTVFVFKPDGTYAGVP